MSQKKTSIRAVKKPAAAAITPVAKKEAAARKKAGASAAMKEHEFMARAWAMEVDAAERYSMLADAMEEHNNREVAELFRKLARIEQLHADRLLEEHLDNRPPALPPGGLEWEGLEAPESADPGELHYLMQPYHALKIALASEKRAFQYFAKVARNTTLAAVREAAQEMALEEQQHFRLVEDWLKRTPVPREDWEHDPDPPVFPD
jgi:rubrerythrin